MPKFNNYRYIYPPRPKNPSLPSEIDKWDNDTMLAQPKMNGSNCVIFMDGTNVHVMNRHNQRLTNFQLDKDELLSLYSGEGWMVINGEYLNKNKSDETNRSFNHKFVIFDILVYNGDYLVGKTFQERVDLLDSLYGTKDSEKWYLISVTENVYRVKTYYNGFSKLFGELIKIDVIEGLVGKRKNARLELGISEDNNSRSQVKFRKPTKSYKF